MKPIWPSRYGRILLYLLPAAFTAATLASTSRLESSSRQRLTLAPQVHFGSPLADLAVSSGPAFDLGRAHVPTPFRLRRGQTLTGLLSELGLERRDALAAVDVAKLHLDVRRLKAGETGEAYHDRLGQLTSLRFRIAGKGRLELARTGGGWTGEWKAADRRVELRHLRGELDDVLITDIRDAGGHPTVAYKMSDVLQWDLDFNRDLRRGDRFEVLYEDVRLDGEAAGADSILALRYENRGTVYEAYRFGEDGFYYDAEGKPLRKMFLRSPLPFSRVTSRFSNRRFHPVLKVHRPHYGVDYGAPTGTPVRVTASGTVSFVGWTKGGGKTVKVRHPNGYLTAYLHLSGYGQGIRSGRRVRQEQVIGFVGATGLATGPHLDYRVQKNGRWIDPLRLPNAPADPIADQEMAAFLAERDALRRRLGNGRSASGALGS